MNFLKRKRRKEGSSREFSSLKGCMKVSTQAESLETCDPAPVGRRVRHMSVVSAASIGSWGDDFLRRFSFVDSVCSDGLCDSRGDRFSFTTRRGSEQPRLFKTRLRGSHASMPPTRLDKRKVRFDSMETREYDVIPGDNPAVQQGAALTVGWTFTVSGPLKINDFEDNRRSRKRLCELKLSEEERERRLIASGYSKRQIQKAAKSSERARIRRLQTLDSLTIASNSPTMPPSDSGSVKSEGSRRVSRAMMDMRIMTKFSSKKFSSVFKQTKRKINFRPQ